MSTVECPRCGATIEHADQLVVERTANAGVPARVAIWRVIDGEPDRSEPVHLCPEGNPMLQDDPWGHHFIWPCGHEAMVMDFSHPLDHPHWCPICEPDRDGCGVEYLDVH